MKNARLAELSERLEEELRKLGFPEELGRLVVMSLGTEKTMERMLSYLKRTRPKDAGEMVDEMLAIKEEFENYRKKKISQYYNEKLNRLMNEGLGEDGEEDEKEKTGAIRLPPDHRGFAAENGPSAS